VRTFGTNTDQPDLKIVTDELDSLGTVLDFLDAVSGVLLEGASRLLSHQFKKLEEPDTIRNVVGKGRNGLKVRLCEVGVHPGAETLHRRKLSRV
jgi:hypothetical protein